MQRLLEAVVAGQRETAVRQEASGAEPMK